MLATLVAILCYGAACQEHILGQYQSMDCQVHGQAYAADWIGKNEPAATLERYKCIPGDYKRAVGL
jgi:hypothetical protein